MAFYVARTYVDRFVFAAGSSPREYTYHQNPMNHHTTEHLPQAQHTAKLSLHRAAKHTRADQSATKQGSRQELPKAAT